MPAPLAKGLIFSLSILFAAGIAVYENPHVRQWVEESRRKIAVALHSLGDEIQPEGSLPSPRRFNDASTREDDSPEAIERRRRAREEILARGRALENRRRLQRGQPPMRASSFDDIVDEEGRLKQESGVTSALKVEDNGAGLRIRNVQVAGTAMGTAAANPFADETLMDFQDEKAVVAEPLVPEQQQSRETTATVQEELAHQLLIPDIDAVSTHPSDVLVDLTPTTSRRSSIHHPEEELTDAEAIQQTHYQSVHQWAESSAAESFYSPPESDVDQNSTAPASRALSETDSIDHVGFESDIDMVSEAGDGTNTPNTWTDVGSVVSDREL